MTLTQHPVLARGACGDDVRTIQRLLTAFGLPVTVDGILDRQTERAVRAFQAKAVDMRGCPLVVDGVVGPLTWWALTHPAPSHAQSAQSIFDTMPALAEGGNLAGRAALQTALAELHAGAGETGGNNAGPWVEKYLHGLAAPGASWCAAFVSWCYTQHTGTPPFRYTLGARDLLSQFRRRGWAYRLAPDLMPEPGDIVVWWRGAPTGWQGHAGLVYACRDGILYTIEGNRTTHVQGFDYVLSRMTRLLGFGRVP